MTGHLKERVDCRSRIMLVMGDENATQTERKIAAFMHDNLDMAMHSTLIELADAIGVSDASVVRFTKSIGYKGFQEFKINAALECIPSNELYNPSLKPTDSVQDLCNKIFSMEISALTRTKNSLDTDTLKKVAEVMAKANRILFTGTGGSMIVAKDAQHKFLKVGIQAYCSEDKDIQLMEASLLGKDDVLLAISHSGNNLHVLSVEEKAKMGNATIVALVSYGKNKISEMADYTLNSMSEKTIFQSESVSTRLAQLAIIDCLVAAIAFQNYDVSLEAIHKTREATSENKE